MSKIIEVNCHQGWSNSLNRIEETRSKKRLPEGLGTRNYRCNQLKVFYSTPLPFKRDVQYLLTGQLIWVDSKRKNPVVSQMKHTLRVSLSALTLYSSSSIASPLTNIQKYSPCDREVIKWREGLDSCRGGIYFLNHCHYGSDQKERGTGTGGETSLGTIAKERDEFRKKEWLKEQVRRSELSYSTWWWCCL